MNLFQTLIHAFQGLFSGGILNWITHLFSGLFPGT